MKIKEIGKALHRRTRQVVGFFRASIIEWLEDKAMRQAAALAFYSIFSLAPLLVISIAVAGFFFGEQAVEGEIVAQLTDFVGYEGAVFIESMLRAARDTGTGLGPTLISLGTMFFGALIIFSALQDALNMIWGVRPHPDMGIWYTVKQRALAFLMILFLGLLLLGSLLVSTGLTIIEAYWDQWFDVDPTLGLWAYTDRLVSLVFFTGIFGVVYKLLPDVRMAWKDVWLGAFMTSVLFMVGEFGVSTYLAFTSVGSVFGAAGTLAVLLLWIYYSWTIVLMGAEMTQVWARKYGSGIRPGKNAVLRVDTTRKVVGGRIKVVRESESADVMEEFPEEEVVGPSKMEKGIQRFEEVQKGQEDEEKEVEEQEKADEKTD